MKKPTRLRIAAALEAAAKNRKWGNGATCPPCCLFGGDCDACTVGVGLWDGCDGCAAWVPKGCTGRMNAGEYWNGDGTQAEQSKFRRAANIELRKRAAELRKIVHDVNHVVKEVLRKRAE